MDDKLYRLSFLLAAMAFSAGCMGQLANDDAGGQATTTSRHETTPTNQAVETEDNVREEITATIQLEGILRQNHWTKSMESYCAQGSDYFTLESDENRTWVLKYSKSLGAYAGQSVSIKANVIQRTISCPEGSQCPTVPAGLRPGTTEPDYTCTILEVKEIVKS